MRTDGVVILGIDSELVGYFPGNTITSSAGAAATPPREGNARFFFCEGGFGKSALGTFRKCNFIPSGLIM